MMTALCGNEIHKILAGRKLHMFVVLSLVFTVVAFLGLNVVSGQLAGTENQIPAPTGQSFPLVILELMVGLIIPLYVLMVVADQMSEESKQGTLKLPLLYGVSRGRLLVAKMVALTLSIALLLGFILIATYSIGIIGGGWGEQFVFGDIILPSVQGVFLTVGAYIVSVIPLLAVGSCILLLSLFTTSTGVLIGLPLGLGLVLKIISDVYPSIAPIFLTTQVFWYTKLLELASTGFVWQNVAPSLGITASYLLVSLLLSVWIFRRKDLLT